MQYSWQGSVTNETTPIQPLSANPCKVIFQSERIILKIIIIKLI